MRKQTLVVSGMVLESPQANLGHDVRVRIRARVRARAKVRVRVRARATVTLDMMLSSTQGVIANARAIRAGTCSCSGPCSGPGPGS